jgi:hypothetical protein
MLTDQSLWIFGALFVANVVLFLIPATLIVRRTGHSVWWMLILLVPFGVFVGLWILAVGRWPALDEKSN